jgi:hypothetical protein
VRRRRAAVWRTLRCDRGPSRRASFTPVTGGRSASLAARAQLSPAAISRRQVPRPQVPRPGARPGARPQCHVRRCHVRRCHVGRCQVGWIC